MNPFLWLRRKAAEAVVLGTADGLRAVTPEGESPPTDLAELREMLAAATDVRAIAAEERAAKELAEAEPTKRKGR